MESRLHHIAHLLQDRGDAQLLLEIHRAAGRLLAVAQGGVEDDDAVARSFVGAGARDGRGGVGGHRCHSSMSLLSR
jgi:hypothetical protein